MNIEKLKSGKYRARKQINGKMIRVTFDHYPTETEVLFAMNEHLDDSIAPKEILIFYNAAKQYVELRRNVISPKTVKEYLGIPDRLSKDFVSKNVYSISKTDVQAEVNRIAKKRAPKTVKNYSSFICSVIKTFQKNFDSNITLPQQEIVEPYIPTDDEVVRFLQYIKDNRPKYYVLVVLGAYSLRRSEIMAITADDVEGNILHVTKAKVQDENNNWVIKPNKTPKSRRDIVIPQDVADMIVEKGVAFEGYPSDISKVINTACKRLNIQHFTLHKLRHYFATHLMANNVDVMTVASLGGWASPAMIYNRYGHATGEKKQIALNHMNKIIEGNL